MDIEQNSKLDRAAQAFFDAAYAYRRALLNHSPQEVGGVIWLRRGGELVAYSDNGRYTEQVMSMTYATAKDELVFAEAKL